MNFCRKCEGCNQTGPPDPRLFLENEIKPEYVEHALELIQQSQGDGIGGKIDLDDLEGISITKVDSLVKQMGKVTSGWTGPIRALVFTTKSVP